METAPFGTKDIVRIVVTLFIVLLVSIFVAPISSVILFFALLVLAYILTLELIKYRMSIKDLNKPKYRLPPSLV